MLLLEIAAGIAVIPFLFTVACFALMIPVAAAVRIKTAFEPKKPIKVYAPIELEEEWFAFP